MAKAKEAKAAKVKKQKKTSRATKPSTETNIAIQLIVGLVGTVAVSIAVMPLKGLGALNYLWGIVNDRGPVQYAELFMTFMIAAMIVMKTRLIGKQLKVVSEGPIPADADLNNEEEIQTLRDKIRSHSFFSHSIVLNRIERMLALWLSSKEVDRVSGWASAESDRDMINSEATYSLSKVLIWAIPIMGFIGTVMGLGSAVSGFAEFLQGSAELSQIKEAISNVTVGLGVAFDTTLLALILSVLVMFPLSNVQKKEENFFVEVDNYLDVALTSKFPSQENQPIIIENLEDAIEAAFRRYIPDPDRYEEVFTRAIDKASRSVEERFTDLTNGYEAAVREMTDSLSGSFSDVTKNLEGSMSKVVADLGVQEQKLFDARRELSNEERERMKSMLEEVQQSASKVAEQYREKAMLLEKAARENADSAVQAAKELSAQMQEVTKMAGNIEELLKVKESVDQSLKTISTTQEFQQTLTDLRSHLTKTDEFCEHLSKPRVITLTEEAVAG